VIREAPEDEDVTSDPQDDESQDHVITFKYQSNSFLKMMKLIPVSPRKSVTLDGDQYQDYLRLLQKEKEEKSEHAKKKVKVEHAEERMKKGMCH
jgi:hypothetical protein